MGLLDDLLDGVDEAIDRLAAAPQKVEDISDGIDHRLEQFAKSPEKPALQPDAASAPDASAG